MSILQNPVLCKYICTLHKFSNTSKADTITFIKVPGLFVIVV